MRKLAYGLTAVSLALSPAFTPEPLPRATSSPISPGTMARVLRCNFHIYALEAAQQKSKEQACAVAQNIGSAILNGKPVAYANDYVWFDKSPTWPTCIIQPVVAEVNGQGYFVNVGVKAHTPTLEMYGLPGRLPSGLDIQQEPIQRGKDDYVSVNNGEPVGQARPDRDNLCSLAVVPR